MPVHLYGQPADMSAILAIAARHNLVDHRGLRAGAPGDERRPPGRHAGRRRRPQLLSRRRTWARSGTRGAVITNDHQLADRVKRLRNGGQTSRYHHDEFGVNSRLDEMQAAILRARLTLLPAWTERRRALGRRYRAALPPSPSSAVRVPPVVDEGHVYHLFPVLSPNSGTSSANASRPGASRRSFTTRFRFPRQPALATEDPRGLPGRQSRLRRGLLAPAPSADVRRNGGRGRGGVDLSRAARVSFGAGSDRRATSLGRRPARTGSR